MQVRYTLRFGDGTGLEIVGFKTPDEALDMMETLFKNAVKNGENATNTFIKYQPDVIRQTRKTNDDAWEDDEDQLMELDLSKILE